jgi:hypothetical protein
MNSPARKKSAPESDNHSRKTIGVSVHLEPDLVTEMRNAVLTLSGPPLFLNMSRMVGYACEEYLLSLRRKFNKGREFPVWPSPRVPTGRPLGSKNRR